MALAFAVSVAFAQDIKIKKDEIQLDGKSVAKIEKVKGSEGYYNGAVFAVSDLNGNLLFTGQTKAMALPNSLSGCCNNLPDLSDLNWLELTGKNGVVEEIAAKDLLKRSMSAQKTIAAFAVQEKFITPNGVDTGKINEFFQTENKSVSTGFSQKITAMQQELQTEAAAGKAIGLRYDNNGNIFSNNNQIGYVIRTQTLVPGSHVGTGAWTYIIQDMNHKPIATFKGNFSLSMSNGTLKTYDNKDFLIYGTIDKDFLNTDQITQRILNKLCANHYLP